MARAQDGCKVEDAKDTRTLRREEQSAQESIKKEEKEGKKTGDDKRMKGRKMQVRLLGLNK